MKSDFYLIAVNKYNKIIKLEELNDEKYFLFKYLKGIDYKIINNKTISILNFENETECLLILLIFQKLKVGNNKFYLFYSNYEEIYGLDNEIIIDKIINYNQTNIKTINYCVSKLEHIDTYKCNILNKFTKRQKDIILLKLKTKYFDKINLITKLESILTDNNKEAINYNNKFITKAKTQQNNKYLITNKTNIMNRNIDLKNINISQFDLSENDCHNRHISNSNNFNGFLNTTLVFDF